MKFIGIKNHITCIDVTKYNIKLIKFIYAELRYK